jgi:putative spermidine/putrescine transport system permease protein
VLRDGVGDVDIWAAFGRSVRLAIAVTVLTVLFSVAAGLAFRRKFRGDTAVFYVSVASLIMPSIIVSLGIGLTFRLLDNGVKYLASAWGYPTFADSYTTSMGLFTSALGAHLTWTLPFGLLVMFAVFNRFNPAYEEASRDLGATPWQSFLHVVLPIIGPSVVGVAMFGFTLSWDEIARTSQAIGDQNTLPLELQGLTTSVTTPVIYALGTMTTLLSLTVMGVCLLAVRWLARRRAVAGLT